MHNEAPSLKAFSVKPAWKAQPNIRRDGIMNRFAMEIRDAVFAMPLQVTNSLAIHYTLAKMGIW